MTENQTYSYEPALNELVNTYNKRGHRTLKYMSPRDAEMDDIQQELLNIHVERYGKIALKRKEPKYAIGQRVRVKAFPELRLRGYDKIDN